MTVFTYGMSGLGALTTFCMRFTAFKWYGYVVGRRSGLVDMLVLALKGSLFLGSGKPIPMPAMFRFVVSTSASCVANIYVE